MKISAQMALVVAVIFAIACFAGSISGFMALDGATDPQKISDARGFAFFWAFLGVIGVAFAAVSWWMIRTSKDGE